MRNTLLNTIAALLLGYGSIQAQTDPLITKWKLNTTNHMVNGILTDVETVHYDANFVYVHTSGVPSYYDFNNQNVNDASDGNFTWKLTRTPQQNTGTPASTLGGGQMGVFIDGDPIFNAEDARSYQNANIWHQLAYYFEYNDFDTTWGHSTPNKIYHHHVLNLALADTGAKTVHSPIVGWFFDGYPIYGPFGYSDANDTSSAITRMTSSYAFRNITQRTTLPDGTALQPSQYGPAINNQYQLGCYREDYIYSAGSGTLDEHNGRFCKTPEYPNGIYAYFCTLDSNNNARYPYTIGQTFYGVLVQGNQGPNGGHNTVPGNATLYVPDTTSTGLESPAITIVKLAPNPALNNITVTSENGDGSYAVSDISGRLVASGNISSTQQLVNVTMLNPGTYLLSVTHNAGKAKTIAKFVKQ